MTIFDQYGEYETENVDHLIKRYLKLIGFSWKEFWNEELPIVNIRAILLLAIKDFSDDKISLDNLSNIASYLCYGEHSQSPKWSPNYIYEIDRELAKTLETASELSYNNWRKTKGLKQANKEVKGYYKNNKNVIGPIKGSQFYPYPPIFEVLRES